MATLEKRRRSAYDKATTGWSRSCGFESDLHKIYRKVFGKVSKKDKDFYGALDKTARDFQDAIDGFGILCLSATCKNILMWSHYAGNHTGLCVEFVRSESNLLGLEAVPVSYSHKRSNTSSGTVFEEDSVFSQKYAGWRHEKEWRLVKFPGNELHPLPGEIGSIIVGAKMDPENIQTIANIIYHKNARSGSGCRRINIKYAEMDPEEYKVNITDKLRGLMG